MARGFFGFAIASLVFAGLAHGAEYRVEAVDTSPPEEVAKEIAELLAPQAYKVASGSRTLCEIWLAKSLALKKDFSASDTVLYPLAPGQLVGVIRYRSKGADFRDQEIAKGVYTLRYAQQPEDGNHVGTSPTRDFLLLSSAEKDQSPKPVDEKTLTERSAEAAESKHPAMLALKKPPEGDGKAAVTHDEAGDLWLLNVTAPATGGKDAKLPIAIVVVGHATE